MLFENHFELEVFSRLDLLQDVLARFGVLSVLVNALLNLFGRRVAQEIGGESLGFGLDFRLLVHFRIFGEINFVVEVVVHILRCGDVVEGIGYSPEVSR